MQHNIPILPGIYNKVCQLMKNKINTGIYNPSNSSYWSRWFCVVKKDGKSLHIVHNLEPLNQVTIKHTRVTPFTDQIGEHVTRHACGGMLNLYVSYDKCGILPSLHDLTMFQLLFGAPWLVTLPMGWTNSVPIFHNNITYILQPEIPNTMVLYIDDVPAHGPTEQYLLADGIECIPENWGICHFI